MSTLAESLGTIKKRWQWIAISGGVVLVWAAVALPTLHRQRGGLESYRLAGPVAGSLPVAPAQAKTLLDFRARESVSLRAADTSAAPGAVISERRIIRTSSMEMVVQHPAEVTDKITIMAESLGGYLMASDGGGQNATAGTLTVRVPASRFEEARAEIRKLALRVESEKVDAQDVTRQYVDQDASIRNLRAEEAGYLAILKHASTVKDMLAVTERLSEVRGQIEQQQAEFNALSKQVETVAISISLRTESEAQVFGLNWRPGYQLKLALRDGLESIATYAAAMTAILFYLPAVLLWVGTILVGAIGSWRIVSWAGRRWFGWKSTVVATQN